jgi:hypothetical protein
VLRKLIIAIIAMTLASSAAEAQATFTVKPDGSGDTATIQDAIDLAVSGDIIVVWGGHYHEDDLLVDGKDIMFQYYNGIPVIISSGYRQGTGITLRDVDSGSSIFGFEFREFETGISIENGGGQYRYCIITDCGTGIGISGASSSPGILFTVVDSCGTGMRVTDGSGTYIRNMTIVNAGIGIESLGGSTTLIRSIINGCGTGALCAGGSLSLSCNNFYLNTAHYSGCSAGGDDFYELTRFCYEAGGSPGLYYLHIDSPCWAENNTCGFDVGAFTQAPGCTGTAVEETSWGAIKKMHR